MTYHAGKTKTNKQRKPSVHSKEQESQKRRQEKKEKDEHHIGGNMDKGLTVDREVEE